MVENRGGTHFSERRCAEISYFMFRRSLIVSSLAKAQMRLRVRLSELKREGKKNCINPSLCGLLLIKQASVPLCAEHRIGLLTAFLSSGPIQTQSGCYFSTVLESGERVGRWTPLMCCLAWERPDKRVPGVDLDYEEPFRGRPRCLS